MHHGARTRRSRAIAERGVGRAGLRTVQKKYGPPDVHFVEVPTPTPWRKTPTKHSINPLSLVFGGLSGECEHRFTGTTSWGLSGTLYAPSGWSYTTLEAKGRFYPNAKVLEGFSLGAGVGCTAVTAKDVCDVDSNFEVSCTSSAVSAATFGVELDYQWLLGTTRNRSVAAGLGAKKLVFLGSELPGAHAALPTARLGVGYAW